MSSLMANLIKDKYPPHLQPNYHGAQGYEDAMRNAAAAAAAAKKAPAAAAPPTKYKRGDVVTITYKGKQREGRIGDVRAGPQYLIHLILTKEEANEKRKKGWPTTGEEGIGYWKMEEGVLKPSGGGRKTRRSHKRARKTHRRRGRHTHRRRTHRRHTYRRR